MVQNKYIIFVFRLIVGGTFIWAGILKIIDPLEFAQNISNYRVFSRIVSFFLALILPWVEVICGFFLILGFLRRGSALLLSLLLFSFLGLIGVTLIRGINIDCGCFGSLNRKLDISLFFTDLVLLLMCLNIYFFRLK